MGKFLSNFQTRKVNCSTLTARNIFGGNFIKIMKTCVNGNTLKLSLLQKWRRDVLVAEHLQGENVLLLDTLKLIDFQGVAHRHFDVA